MVSKVLAKTGSTVQARGMLYEAVSQTLLIYISGSWVVTGAILKGLGGFHHQAARKIVRIADWHTEDREWEYPPVADTLESTGLWRIKEYI